MIRSEAGVEAVVEAVVVLVAEVEIEIIDDIGRASLPLRDEGRDDDTKDNGIGNEDDKEANEEDDEEKEGGDISISAPSLPIHFFFCTQFFSIFSSFPFFISFSPLFI